jgi:hypothetical protein
MMKSIPRQSLFSCALSLLGMLGTPGSLFGQAATAYLPVVEPGRSLIGVPLDYPPLLSGNISRFLPPSSLQLAESDSSGESWPLSSHHCYLEIVGPFNHPWLGHRLEVDEVATRKAGGGVVALDLASTLNTAWPRPDLAGASVVIRPHLTLQGLFEKNLSYRLAELRAEALKFWLSAAGGPPWLVEPRSSPQGGLVWAALSKGRIQPVQEGETILPPGKSVQVESRLLTTLRTSLTGVPKTHPCRSPLSAGPNLLAYPYPAPMRLGFDWGNPSSGVIGSSEVRNSDQISFWSQDARRFLTYGYFQPSGSPQGIWREIRSLGGSVPSWGAQPPQPVILEPGEGWIYRKISADPNHTFNPPKP